MNMRAYYWMKTQETSQYGKMYNFIVPHCWKIKKIVTNFKNNKT